MSSGGEVGKRQKGLDAIGKLPPARKTPGSYLLVCSSLAVQPCHLTLASLDPFSLLYSDNGNPCPVYVSGILWA